MAGRLLITACRAGRGCMCSWYCSMQQRSRLHGQRFMHSTHSANSSPPPRRLTRFLNVLQLIRVHAHQARHLDALAAAHVDDVVALAQRACGRHATPGDPALRAANSCPSQPHTSVPAGLGRAQCPCFGAGKSCGSLVPAPPHTPHCIPTQFIKPSVEKAHARWYAGSLGGHPAQCKQPVAPEPQRRGAACHAATPPHRNNRCCCSPE